MTCPVCGYLEESSMCDRIRRKIIVERGEIYQEAERNILGDI
jgi:hypothetical protein